MATTPLPIPVTLESIVSPQPTTATSKKTLIALAGVIEISDTSGPPGYAVAVSPSGISSSGWLDCTPGRGAPAMARPRPTSSG
jgi:hypothetical protein